MTVLRFHHSHEFGRIFENGSTTGLLYGLAKSNIHFIVGRISPDQMLHRKFDFTVQYSQVYDIEPTKTESM